MRKWLLVGSLCLAACSARTPEGAESAESAIVGGESASQYPEAVLINMPHGTCSGALVAPRVVLTAAHCIVGHGGWTVYAPYADEQYSDANASDVFDYSAVGAVLDPSHHDVGLLYLDHAIRLARYPTIASAPLADGESLVPIGRVVDGYISTNQLFVGAPKPVSRATTFQFDYRVDPVIQSGDSGGPCEVPGSPEHEIVAVSSGYGMTDNVLARVDLVHDWIQAKIASHGGAGPSASTGACTGAEREPNDARADAGLLVDGTCGALGADDVDWFTFSLDAGGIDCAVELAAGGDAVLGVWKKLVNGTLQRVRISDGRAASTSSAAASYFVSVRSPSGAAQPYRLHVVGP